MATGKGPPWNALRQLNKEARPPDRAASDPAGGRAGRSPRDRDLREAPTRTRCHGPTRHDCSDAVGAIMPKAVYLGPTQKQWDKLPALQTRRGANSHYIIPKKTTTTDLWLFLPE